MHFSTLLRLGLAARAASAAPQSSLASRDALHSQNVVFWGQNAGGAAENKDLAAYCAPSSGIDVLVLAVLHQYGHGSYIPSGTIGQCSISSSGEGRNCEAIMSAIETCHAAGVRIYLSIGGASSSRSLQSQAQAEAVGQHLWDVYGNSGNASVSRPFGSNYMIGFNFDIQEEGESKYFPSMIARLRANFASDPMHGYYITGSPQSATPQTKKSEIISNSLFDYVFVPFDTNSQDLYHRWTAYLSTTLSKNARIFISVPDPKVASKGGAGHAGHYITPQQLATLVNQVKTEANFGGILMPNAGFSDTKVANGCNYAQQAHHILLTGKPCDSSGPITTKPAAASPTSMPSSTTQVWVPGASQSA